MRLLITNDDGVHAPGLWALVERAVKHPEIEVVVIAPDRERSATGHAISIHQPIDLREVPFDSPRAKVYASSGTPADCVKLAIEGVMEEKPDFLISGINRGPNLGTDVFYSGTVSAALEGALLGVKSMAISLTAFENLDYTAAAEFAIEQALCAAHDSAWPALVNVNVPAIPRESIAGVAITRLGVQTYKDAIKRREDPRGRHWYWLSGVLVENGEIDDTDTCAVRRNLISITPLRVDLTDVRGIDALSRCAFRWPPDEE
ncbi:MAG TPA: 5'/3'-nucleotidase SurE [Firmicutes bacterium]|nr:5'/3'-nucleotidase SurE [Candidatus Fermentithermobacillaceae bacterium]